MFFDHSGMKLEIKHTKQKTRIIDTENTQLAARGEESGDGGRNR